MALSLDKPLLLVRVGGGGQPEHEDRMQTLGKHVNISIPTVATLLPSAQEALNRAKSVPTAIRQSNTGLAVFSIVTFLINTTLHFAALRLSSGASALWLTQCASLLILGGAYTALHLGAMSDQLQSGFRRRASLRNGLAFMFIACALGFILTWLPEQQEIGRYWAAHIFFLLVMGIAVRNDNKEFERWYDYGTSDLTEGVNEWGDNYVWYPRNEVVAHLKTDNFRRIQPRPSHTERNRKGKTR